ncbi:hypothetical protein INR49_008320 [Caranx melampygus]|nr:hypothetical protein INR49_008320 [Caranx melampygus]
MKDPPTLKTKPADPVGDTGSGGHQVRECNALLDLNSLFTEAKVYHNKLVNIRKEMIMLHEKTTKLKKRALKLQQQKQKEALEKEQQREKELERERQLIAKPAKRA